MRKIIAFLTIFSGCLFIALLIFYIILISATNMSSSSKTTSSKPIGSVASTEPKPAEFMPSVETSPASDEPVQKKVYESFYYMPLDGEPVTFDSLTEDIATAKEQSYDIYYKNNELPVINNNFTAPTSYRIEEIPLILQNPELPRGCEVTSLAMLINYCGIETDKLILAEKIKRDTTQRELKNKKVYWGNPNNGFIGDMYDIKKPGLGVYHSPIFELLAQYFPTRAVDLTGCEFEDLKWLLANNIPVWVIINSTYAPLPDKSFITWNTPDGAIKITYREHSALITGYDEQYIYLNDPLFSQTKTAYEPFVKCWEQMGNQAVTLNP